MPEIVPAHADPRDSMTPQQVRAAELRSIGTQWQAVASQVGVSERTVRRWSEERAFKALIREIQSDVLADAHRVRGETLTIIERRFQEMIQNEWDDMSIDQRIKVYDTIVKHSPKPPEVKTTRTLNQNVTQNIEWKTGGASVVTGDGKVVEIDGDVVDVAIEDDDSDDGQA